MAQPAIRVLAVSDIYPTGSCFEDSIRFLAERCEAEPGARTRYVLVHAKIVGEDGRIHAHSWVEDPGKATVWTAGILRGEHKFFEVPKGAYRNFVQAHDITVYSVAEAEARQARHGHPPPWELRYRLLCRDYLTEPAGSGAPGRTA